jgi:hypothetical protein
MDEVFDFPVDVVPDAIQLWSFLPEFVQLSDSQNGFPLLLWLNGMCSQLQVIDNLCRDMGENPGWSIIMDVNRCPTYALPWLAQFVGTRFNSYQVQTDAQMRAAIANPAGWGRGTVAAIEAAALPLLNPGGYVRVDERTTDAYHFTVEAFGLPGYTYEQLDAKFPTYAQLDAAFATYNDFTQNVQGLIDALLTAKPAGLIMDISLVRNYEEIDAAYTPYHVLDESFPNYGSIA